MLERIDAYLLDRMSGAERSAFEADMSRDPELVTQVDAQRRIHDAVGYRQVSNILGQLGRNAQPRPARRIIVRMLAIAAGVVLLVCLGIVFLRQQPEEKQLFARYYEADPGMPTLMGAEQGMYVFMEGMVAYRSGKYDSALKLWAGLEDQTRFRDTLSFYRAMANIGLGKFDNAITDLEHTGRHGEFAHKRDWYLALALVRTGQYADAKTLLEEIRASQSPWRQPAEELLAHISR